MSDLPAGTHVWVPFASGDIIGIVQADANYHGTAFLRGKERALYYGKIKMIESEYLVCYLPEPDCPEED